MFRYRMIRETGCCWVDTDFVCLKKPSFIGEPTIFCRQADSVSTLLVNNAVLRLPPSEPALAELVATAESAIDVDQKWGALGPFLLTPVLQKHGLYDRALEPRVCYPIEPEQFWKPFLPSRRAEVEEALAGATLMHLWSEAIRWSKYELSVCPPVGSYLQDRFRRVGALDRFSRTADEDEVRRLMGAQIAACEERENASAGKDRSEFSITLTRIARSEAIKGSGRSRASLASLLCLAKSRGSSNVGSARTVPEPERRHLVSRARAG